MKEDCFAEKVAQAARCLLGRVPCSALEPSAGLGNRTKGVVLLKRECDQAGGSCKIRSASYTLLSFTEDQRARGVVTASTGNNGIAASRTMTRMRTAGTVFVPRTASDYKIDKIRESEVDLRILGDDIVETEVAARSYARRQKSMFFSPYNNWNAVFAQGTIAQEVADQVRRHDGNLDAILVPVGGGGLISGMGGYLKAVHPGVEIIGVLPEQSAVMLRSLEAGRIVEIKSGPTLSDATAGGVERGSITFSLCRKYVDRFVEVSEDEIGQAMAVMYQMHGLLLEGSGALSVAALLQQPERFSGKTVVLLLCGSNIAPADARKIYASYRHPEGVG